MGKQNRKFIDIGTWLPVFPGFYETMFGYDNFVGDLDWTLFNDPGTVDKDVLQEVIELAFDNTDYREFEKDVSKACTDFIESICQETFPDIIKSITFEEVSSPREYNFTNDSINVKMSVDFDLLLKTFISYKGAAEFLKDRYTSYDGFMSSYPNNMADWIENAFEDQNHTTASMLEFLIYAENDSDSLSLDMYYHCSDSICGSDYINYDAILEAINDRYTYDKPLENFADLEGYEPIKGGTLFMQLLTGIRLFETEPENMPETDFVRRFGLNNTMQHKFKLI